MSGNQSGKLSQAILDMKFMKRSKERAQKVRDLEESELMFSDVITDKLRQGASKFLIERSYVPCEELTVGRLSFQGMNPYIERIMREEEEEKLRKLQPKLEADVSEEEMANRYNTLVGNISNKFAKRSRQPSHGQQQSHGRQPSHGHQQSHGRQPSHGQQQSHGRQQSHGHQPSHGREPYHGHQAPHKRASETVSTYESKTKKTMFLKPNDD